MVSQYRSQKGEGRGVQSVRINAKTLGGSFSNGEVSPTVTPVLELKNEGKYLINYRPQGEGNVFTAV